MEYNCCMHVISVKTLRHYWERHADVQDALSSWYDFVRKISWTNPVDIKKDFPSASILSDNRVVFNIKGNQYRLVARLNYATHSIYIRFMGTHSEYERIDASKV